MTLKNVFICSLSLTLLAGCKSEEINKKEVDVCIYGGTSAGITAAYAAKKMGKSVVVIEPGKYIGGMTTGGLGSTDIGNKYAVTGLARLFYRRIGEHYNKFEQWMFPPSVAKKVMNRFVSDADLDIRYQYRINSSDVENGRIKQIRLESADKADPDKELVVQAKQYIDCTYEGDLMAKSGVSYAVGREDNSCYGESLNGVQLSYWHQFPDGVDPYIVEGDSTSGLCWGISQNPFGNTGQGDSLVQAYNFRLCLTNNPNNRVPFERPATYDSTRYELLARAIPKIGTDINKYLLINWGEMPEEKYDVNNRGPLSTDLIGMNHQYPDGNYELREKIWNDHVEYTKGLLYFLTHDSRIPEELRQKVAEFGWTKDEFVDNGHFPTQLYIREARRMKGEYVMTQKNCEGKEVVEDGIGLAAYIMDSHNCQRIIINGMVKNEGDVQTGGFPPYPISYRSITPKRSECVNLLVPVCLSASHIAYGSLRMEPVFMVLGQSAGIAASLAIDNSDNIVQDVAVSEIHEILNNNPYLDGSTPEILVDDTNAEIQTNGDWVQHYGYYYKSSYMQSANKTPDCSFVFLPQIRQTGKYQIHFYCSASIEPQNMPEVMTFYVQTKNGSERVQLEPRKYIGEWIGLGEFDLEEGTPEIRLDGKESVGPLFADAIIVSPI